jgi:hypothetical protein
LPYSLDNTQLSYSGFKKYLSFFRSFEINIIVTANCVTYLAKINTSAHVHSLSKIKKISHVGLASIVVAGGVAHPHFSRLCCTSTSTGFPSSRFTGAVKNCTTAVNLTQRPHWRETRDEGAERTIPQHHCDADCQVASGPTAHLTAILRTSQPQR